MLIPIALYLLADYKSFLHLCGLSLDRKPKNLRTCICEHKKQGDKMAPTDYFKRQLKGEKSYLKIKQEKIESVSLSAFVDKSCENLEMLQLLKYQRLITRT